MRTDAELMRAARKDAVAFGELYERYATRIYAFNLARTSDPDAAFDLTAETFAQAVVRGGGASPDWSWHSGS